MQRGWCAQPDARKDARYSEACDPWSHEFGAKNWAVGPDGALHLSDPTRWQDVQDESTFCEVLGRVRSSNVELFHAPAVICEGFAVEVVLGFVAPTLNRVSPAAKPGSRYRNSNLTSLASHHLALDISHAPHWYCL